VSNLNTIGQCEAKLFNIYSARFFLGGGVVAEGGYPNAELGGPNYTKYVKQEQEAQLP